MATLISSGAGDVFAVARLQQMYAVFEFLFLDENFSVTLCTAFGFFFPIIYELSFEDVRKSALLISARNLIVQIVGAFLSFVATSSRP